MRPQVARGIIGPGYQLADTAPLSAFCPRQLVQYKIQNACMNGDYSLQTGMYVTHVHDVSIIILYISLSLLQQITSAPSPYFPYFIQAVTAGVAQ